MEIKRFTAGPFLTNTYLIISGVDALIVDPTMGLERHIDKINQYNIKGILLTHGHIDHIASTRLFDCPIYVYKDEKKMLFDSELNLSMQFGIPFSFPNNQILELSDDEIIEFNDIDIKVIHTPGHTSGSVCYLIDNNYLISGDTLFQMSVGRTDFPTGSSQMLVKSIKKLIDTLPDSVIVYPGHGEATTILDEVNNPYYNV